MSFRCQLCGKPQPPGTSPIEIIVGRRRVIYVHQGKRGNSETYGWEIAKTIAVCEECAAKRKIKVKEFGEKRVVCKPEVTKESRKGRKSRKPRGGRH